MDNVINMKEYDETLKRLENDPNLDDMIDALKEVADSNEDIQNVRELSERAATYVPDEDVRQDVGTYALDQHSMPIYTTEANELKEADIDLMNSDDLESINEDNIKRLIGDKSAESGLSDADANALLDCLLTYRRDKKANIFAMLPLSLKEVVNNICATNNLPITQRNFVARELMEEFLAEAKAEQEFIDIEKALDKAMRIPSLTDMYNEHISETMDEKIPEMADAIQDEDPERADMLRAVGRNFAFATTFEELRRQYDSTTLIRKAVRRDYEKWQRMADQVNFINQDTKFKMPDARVVVQVLTKVLLEEEDSDFSEADVFKFCALLFKGIDKYREDNIVNASYIYYLLKNITMLSYSNDKARGSYSAELISNIKTTIYYIRVKEAEFNALNKSNKDDHRNKRSRRKR